MADSANATAACNLVAIDVARYGDAVLVETTNGKRHPFKMANNARMGQVDVSYQFQPSHSRLGAGGVNEPWREV